MKFEAIEAPLPTKCKSRNGFKCHASDSQLTIRVELHPPSPNDASYRNAAKGGISELHSPSVKEIRPL